MHCLSVFRRNTLKTIGEFSHRPSKLLSNVRFFRVSNRIVDFWAKEEERKKSKVLSEIRLIQFAKRIWFPCNDFRTNYFPHFDVYIVAVIVRCSLLLLGFFQVFDVLYVQLEAHCDFILCDLLSYVHCEHGFEVVLFVAREHILYVNNFEWFIGNISKVVDTFRVGIVWACARRALKRRAKKGKVTLCRPEAADVRIRMLECINIYVNRSSENSGETKKKTKRNKQLLWCTRAYIATYHERVKKRSNTNNPRTDFVKMAVIALGIPIDPLAFFPMLPFHFGCLAIVADTPD